MVAYPESKILGGENTTKALLLINNQDTIGPLCRTELTGVRDAHALGHSEGRTRSKTGDGALGRLLVLELGLSSPNTGSGWLTPLSGKFILDLLA